MSDIFIFVKTLTDREQHSYINSLNNGYEPFRGPVRREHPLVSTANGQIVKAVLTIAIFIRYEHTR